MKLLKIIGLIIITLAILDCITTFLNPNYKQTEMNPIIDIIDSTTILVLIKLTLSVILTFMITKTNQNNHTAYYLLILIAIYFITFNTYLVYNNTKAIQQQPTPEQIKEINKPTTLVVSINRIPLQQQPLKQPIKIGITTKKKNIQYSKIIWQTFSPMLLAIATFLIYEKTYKTKKYEKENQT